MSFLGDWDDIVESLEAQRKKYGGSSIGGSVAAASSGKGFRFPDDDAADKIVRSFRARAESMFDRDQRIDEAEAELIKRFSRDRVSDSYRERALESLAALKELNQSAFKYALNYVKKIEAVKRERNATEDVIGGDAAKLAERLG